MGYLLLAVMFYTVVRFGTQIWEHLRYEKQIKTAAVVIENQLVKSVNKVIEKL